MGCKNKKLFTVNVTEIVLEEFSKLAEIKSINKSLLIENFLKEWLSLNEIRVDINNCNSNHSYQEETKNV